ncbi:HNH endonuclease [Pseudomonas protegens]|uniref:HNH endonuclease n=1 Tax=Pseudomonas protegens TaxID=380021 RepID=UPI0032EB5AAD
MAITEWYLNIEQLPTFSQATIDYIEALKPHKSKHWELQTNEMKAYKKELLTQLLDIQGNRCAYCGLGLERSLVDREHFVHKDQNGGWPEFMFVAENLIAACAYCNRALKGRATTITTYSATYSNCIFNLVHPVLDTPNADIEFIPDSHGDAILAKSLTQKGLDTLRFFELETPIMTAKRAAYLVEVKRMEEMSAANYAELKAISQFKPS